MGNLPFTIVVDSREKKPYSFYGVDVVRTGLETGDYTIQGYEDTFAVERKSLDDLANTLGQNRERFKREVDRAQAFDEFVVVIEADRQMLFDRDRSGHCVHYYSKMWPNAILATVDGWPSKYETLEFRWANDRAGGKAMTLDLLTEWYRIYG